MSSYTYEVGDQQVDITGCTATDDVDGDIPCSFTGYVDMSTAGNYIVTYYAIDSAGNETYLHVTYHIVDPSNPDGDPDIIAYYSTALGLTGNTLLLELRSIINTGMLKISYGDARYILNLSDADPDIAGNVKLVYSGLSVSGNWDDGTFTREHVWPQSLLDTDVSNTTKNVGTDLHNLKPENQSWNSSRGNKYFDVATTTVSYLPRAEVRGDVARILFYMVVMYNYLELINGTPTVYQMAMLDVLIQWHQQDPVDDFERNRNNVIFSYQRNRNPFIDYPEFVGMIWPT